MNGKEMFLGLKFIGEDLVEEAEFGRFAARTERGPVKIRRPFLIAAIIALMVFLMGCAVAYAQGWFASYFSAQSEAPLSDGQISFIAEHEQVINETKVQNKWAVELKSAISDGETAYIIMGVRAPEGVWVGNEIVDGIVEKWMHLGGGADGTGDVITCSAGNASLEGNYWYLTGSSWTDDGDGLENTGNVVYHLNFNKIYADQETVITEPFGPDMDFDVHIENIYVEYEDEEYRQELLNGKYKGQTDIMFTPEETERLLRTDIVAEGTWDFTINFAENGAGVELLSAPVTTEANVIKNTGPGIGDYVYAIEAVKVTSFVLKPLSATVYYEYDGGVNFTDSQRSVFAVMKDGSRIELHD